MAKYKKRKVMVLPPIKKTLPPFDNSMSETKSKSSRGVKSMHKSPSKGVLLVANPPIRELDELTSMQTPIPQMVAGPTPIRKVYGRQSADVERGL